MRVLITGGTGLIGKVTTERLVEKGWDVRVIGIEPEFEFNGVEYAQCDILNYDDVLRHMTGCDAVIHLAAIRGPQLAPGQDVFRVNVAGTFNIFEAAAKLGIRRIVQASSINALGCFYGTVEMNLRYLPVDEEHPVYTTDPYSFSKQTIEEIGQYYWRRDGISSVALRFPGVYRQDTLSGERYLQKRELAQRFLDELTSLPESEQQARVRDAQQRAAEYRSQRPFEFRPDHTPSWNFNVQEDPLFWMYAIDRFNFWAFIDERDAAQSLEKGLTADYEGAHALFVNDHHNSIGYAVRTLARLFFPDVSHYKTDMPGSASLVSIDKARALIGFEPEHSVESLGQH